MSIEELKNLLPEERTGTERRQNSLTRADLDILDKLITIRIEAARAHDCHLSPDDLDAIHALRAFLLTASTEIKSGFIYIIKWGLLLIAFILVVLSLDHMGRLTSVFKDAAGALKP